MMNKYYQVTAEVPGGLGEKTQFDKTVVPWNVTSLHIILDGWLGSDLLNVSPCFLVTRQLMDSILLNNLTGVEKFESVEVTISDTFKELYPHRIAPKFFLMHITGKPRQDDFGKTEKNKLVISQKAYDLLQNFELSITEFTEDKR